MIHTFVETEHIKFEFRLTPDGGRVNIFWNWLQKESNPMSLRVTGGLSPKQTEPNDVEIFWMELPEGGDFDAICTLLEKTVRTEYATIADQYRGIVKQLKERFNANRQ